MSWTVTLKDAFDGNPRTQRARTYLSLYLLLSLFFLSVQPDFVFSKDQQFSWKTGQWSQCIGEKCGSGGVQTRTIWCVHTEGWTTHYTHCQHMDKPESQRDCFKVCDWHQNLFEWEVLDWGHCVLAPLFFKELKLRNTECITAQHGIQRRKVHCVRTSNHTTVTARICEFFSPKPPAEQACLIPCPQDCVVSDFIAWSSCSKTCGVGLQHRTRHVLATPIYGGESCPNLTETRPCSNHLSCPTGESQYHFSLKAGAWSECRLFPLKDTFLRGRTTVDFNTSSDENKTVTMHKQLSHHHPHQHQHQSLVHRNPLSWEHEVGYRIRKVRCIRSDGKNSMQSLCIKDNSPLTFQLCVMPKDCQTSDWSLWSPCSKTCRSTDLSPGYRLRSRIMTHIPVGGGKQCPALKEKEACNIIGDVLPICPRFVWRTTDWGECHVLPLLSQQDQRLGNISNLCGGGIRSRRPYCVQVSDDSTLHDRKEVSRPVDARLCATEEPPSSVQHCYIPCQHHCLLSHWSPWGACIHDNCREPQRKKGFRKRTREVLWKSGSPWQACPHLVEFIPCEDPACYLWQVQQEGGCILNKATCGPGTVAQKVTCVSAEGKEVQNAHCLDDPPPTEVACEVVCPDDCVVGPWSFWSPCSHSCASKLTGGQQSRTRTMLAIPGKEGRNCPAAPALEEWRVCNDHPCIAFYWDASPWGPCIEDASMNISGLNLWNETSSCGVGIQIRRVSCMKMNFGPVQSKRCSESTRPESVQPCSLACKKDCIVTPFSEWSACPTFCVPDNTTQATQSRYRIIIQRPSGGGQECPDTLYEERECESLPVCPDYRWRPHQWQSCKVVPDSVHRGLHGEACGNGLETRGLSCVKDSDEPASMTECLRWAGPLPPQIRPCWVACKDDCTLTVWSEFSECSGCGSSRNRKRSLTGPSKKKEHCLNEELYPLEDTETCPCQKFLSLPFGNWSACILPEPSAPGQQGWMNNKERKECGPGLRYRAVACIDQKGHLTSPILCTDSGFMVESCHIPCPLDCKLSEWSPWSACSASCGSGLKIRSKWLREKAFNGGRPCPKLDLKNQAQVNEAVTCHTECSQYEWRIEPWSICAISTVDALPGCGEGVQSRKVRCVKKGTGSEARHVEDSLCDHEETPPRVQVCFLACPGDCVVTSWGPWSNCPLHCDQGTTRHRTRDILRLPASENSSCPDLVQSEPCVLNSTCVTYQYRVSDWSTCHLSEQAVCGLGIRLRLLDCIRSDGKTVELQWCEQLGLINKWRLFESCMVDCPVSCILSDWSPWAECSHTCGSKGQAVRTRRILQESHEEGRPCPTQLVQTKPCPIKPCYKWLLSDWSPCIVEGARCGEGLRRRNLTCSVHWGNWPESSAEPVDEELCGDKLRQELQQDMEQSCFVPCPGDCHLTVWSPWSSCQLTCLEGRSFETTGHQARSRAVIIQVTENQESCPHQIFETRHCKGGKCHSYQWRTGGWSNNKREVWCQRSDGVNVTGGCFQQKKPATVRHCHPPCTKPFSFCTPNGVCGCEKGYTEVMTTHGFLDYCTRTPGVDNNKKADVKTDSGRLKPGPSQAQDLYREWTLRPVGQDGRVKLWVYAVTAVGFILILFIIALSFLVCSPSKTTKTSPQPQKPLTLAYDGDMDM